MGKYVWQQEYTSFGKCYCTNGGWFWFEQCSFSKNLRYGIVHFANSFRHMLNEKRKEPKVGVIYIWLTKFDKDISPNFVSSKK